MKEILITLGEMRRVKSLSTYVFAKMEQAGFDLTREYFTENAPEGLVFKQKEDTNEVPG